MQNNTNAVPANKNHRKARPLVQDLPSPVVQFVFLSGGYGVVVADCSCIREQPCVTVPLHYLVFIFSTNSTIHAETKKN